MDANNSHGDQHDHESQHISPGDCFPQPTISPSRLSSASSYDSHDVDLTKYVHPPAPDLDETRDTRGRDLLMNRPRGNTPDKLKDKTSSKHFLKAEESHNSAMHADDSHGSDISSASTSDDVELERFGSNNRPSDDEDTGLTKNNLSRRKQRRKHQRVDESVMGTRDITHQERQSADKSVLKALLINALLIAAWYAFSLSISIVSQALTSTLVLAAANTGSSTISGCSHLNTSIFTSLYSRLVCTCLFNSLWPPWFSTSSRPFARAGIVSPTRIIIAASRKPRLVPQNP